MKYKECFPPGLYVREQTTEQYINLLKIEIDFYPLNPTYVRDSWSWKVLESSPIQILNIFASSVLTYSHRKLTTFRNSLLWTEQIMRKFISNLSSCKFHSFKLLNCFYLSDLHMAFPSPIHLPLRSCLSSLNVHHMLSHLGRTLHSDTY